MKTRRTVSRIHAHVLTSRTGRDTDLEQWDVKNSKSFDSDDLRYKDHLRLKFDALGIDVDAKISEVYKDSVDIILLDPIDRTTFEIIKRNFSEIDLIFEQTTRYDLSRRGQVAAAALGGILAANPDISLTDAAAKAIQAADVLLEELERT
jgi:hypothetical protein